MASSDTETPQDTCSDTSEVYLSYEERQALFRSELDALIKSDSSDSRRKLNEILATAIENNSIDTIDYLLTNNFKPDVLNEVNQTALHLLVYNNYLDKVDLFFGSYGGDVNYTDSYGLTHLHIACLAGKLDIVEQLLSRGANIEGRFLPPNPLDGRNGFTPLHFAVANARLNIVELLLSRDSNVYARDQLGRTPLHLACGISDSYCVLMINIFCKKEDRQWRAKTVAEENTELEIVKLLVVHESNLNAKDLAGNTPPFLIFQNDSYARINVLSSRREAYIYCNFIHKVVVNELRKKQLAKLEFLLQQGVDIKARNDSGETLLHRVIDRMKVLRWPERTYDYCFEDDVIARMVEVLLSHGVDINTKNDKGETALQIAVSVLSVDIVKVLLEHGADLHSVRFDFTTERCFHYPNTIPCLEATQNLLDIVEILENKRYKLSLMENLVVLKFFLSNDIDYKYPDPISTEGEHSIFNLLLYGSFESICRVFKRISQEGPLHYMSTDLYSHLKLIEFGNLYMSEVVKDAIRAVLLPGHRIMGQYLDDCKDEMEVIKGTAFGNGKTLSDILSMHPDKVYLYIKSVNYKPILCTDDFKRTFSSYDLMIKGHFVRCLIRRYVLESSKDYLCALTGVDLPDLCSEKILNYLSNENLWHLCLAITVKVSAKKMEA